VKGSPEAIGALITQKPAGYDQCYFNMAQNGMRVLALAYRKLNSSESALARDPGVYSYVSSYSLYHPQPLKVWHIIHSSSCHSYSSYLPQPLKV
jgi:hypothetical protein